MCRRPVSPEVKAFVGPSHPRREVNDSNEVRVILMNKGIAG